MLPETSDANCKCCAANERDKDKGRHSDGVTAPDRGVPYSDELDGELAALFLGGVTVPAFDKFTASRSLGVGLGGSEEGGCTAWESVFPSTGEIGSSFEQKCQTKSARGVGVV